MNTPLPLQIVRGTYHTVRLAAGTFEVPGKGEFNQAFSPGCFDSQIGLQTGMTVQGEWVCNVKILAADVSEDGMYVELSYEIL